MVISTFPACLDNPDINEFLLQVWSEDVFQKMIKSDKQNVQELIEKARNYISKIYPVIYSNDFHFKTTDPTESAAGNIEVFAMRKKLLGSALRFGVQGTKERVTEPIERMTSFKPFNIRELEFEVYDAKEMKQLERGIRRRSASRKASSRGA